MYPSVGEVLLSWSDQRVSRDAEPRPLRPLGVGCIVEANDFTSRSIVQLKGLIPMSMVNIHRFFVSKLQFSLATADLALGKQSHGVTGNVQMLHISKLSVSIFQLVGAHGQRGSGFVMHPIGKVRFHWKPIDG